MTLLKSYIFSNFEIHLMSFPYIYIDISKYAYTNTVCLF